MIYKIFILTILSFLCTTFSACAEVQAINQLLSSGKLLLDISSLGGHSESCIQVVATNTSSEALFTRIEPGRIFLSQDPNDQDIVVTQEMIIALAPRDAVIKQAYGFCCQSQNSGPSFGSTYAFGPMSSGQLLQVANYLNRHRELDQDAQQHAIWVMSDCAPVSSISQFTPAENDLASFVSEALGIPKPWYQTDHRPMADALFSRKVDRIRGAMPFSVNCYDKITVIIVDENNKIVKTVLQSTNYGPGAYDLPLDLFVNFWPSGEYSVFFKGETQGNIGSYTFTI